MKLQIGLAGTPRFNVSAMSTSELVAFFRKPNDIVGRSLFRFCFLVVFALALKWIFHSNAIVSESFWATAVVFWLTDLLSCLAERQSALAELLYRKGAVGDKVD